MDGTPREAGDRGGAGLSPFAEPLPPVGQLPVILAALTVGIGLMAIQLWLLTVALDLYLAGRGPEVWRAALVSGGIFLGGLGMLWIVHRRLRVPGMTTR